MTPSYLSEILSAELLETIVDHLIPAPIPTCLFDPDAPPIPGRFLADPKYVRIDQMHLDRWRRERRTLLSLARASRRLLNFCEPQLWHSVAVHEERSLTDLISTLRARTDAAARVRDIYIVGPTMARYDEGNQVPWYDSELISTLTSLTPNVADILCIWHPYTPAPSIDILPSVLNQARSTFHRVELSEVTLDKPLDAHLSQLTSLRLGLHSLGVVVAEQTAFEVFQLLPFLPHVSTLELSVGSLDIWHPQFGIEDYFLDPFVDKGDLRRKEPHSLESPYIRWGASSAPDEPGYEPNVPLMDAPAIGLGLPQLPGLRHLRIFSSSVCEFALALVVQRCPNLESLLIKFEAGFAPDWMDEPPSEDCRINAALLARSRTLTSLTLLGGSPGNPLHAEPSMDNVPENRRLWCLPELTSLRHLTIDLYGLFGDPLYLTEDHAAQFPSLIPKSVRSLELVPQWDSGEYVTFDISGEARDCVYVNDLVQAVRALLIFLHERPRQLHTLTLGLMALEEDSAFKDPLDRMLGTLREAARKDGTRFVVRGVLPSPVDLMYDSDFVTDADAYGIDETMYERYWPRIELAEELDEEAVVAECELVARNGID